MQHGHIAPAAKKAGLGTFGWRGFRYMYRAGSAITAHRSGSNGLIRKSLVSRVLREPLSHRSNENR